MSTTAKVVLGLAGVAVAVMLYRRYQAANQANYFTRSTPPAPAPLGYVPVTFGPAAAARSGRDHF
jgi:hypothetical protein